MPTVVQATVGMIVLKPLTERVDAIQSFDSQETILVTITDAEGAAGTGYAYTIGSGGSSICALLRDHLLPRLIGRDADRIESIWRELAFSIHALTVGPIASLALAAIDTALWDLRCRRAATPLNVLAGGAHERLPLYSTEGGWLHLSTDDLVADAVARQAAGFRGAKIKIGRPTAQEDHERLAAVRAAVGPSWALMVDANQRFTQSEALVRCLKLADVGLSWIEEPMPADDIAGHARLAAASPIPVAVGESLYSLSQFKDYLHLGACGIVQVDVARIGGITPWLKVAHLAEAYNTCVSPHFLMEIHANIGAAVPNCSWIEYIPQLQDVVSSQLPIHDGYAHPSSDPGVGIDWNWDRIHELSDDASWVTLS
jgi:L-alanine-DL-glutamate epimerase-like enolase superfamily enzyme